MIIGFGAGAAGILWGTMIDTLRRIAAVAALLLAGLSAHAQPLSYQDLWWAGTQENGWGMSISQQGSTLFCVLYVYDLDGRPQWIVMPGGAWNAGFTSYTGALYIPAGSPFSSYDASRFLAGPAVGNATLDFATSDRATLRYTINGVSGSKAITRQSFGAGAALGNYTDLWWGGQSQNGWGVSLTQQGSVVFGVWYTYDTEGRPTWMVMPDGRFTSANTLSGALYRTAASAWLNANYDASRLRVNAVGTMSFVFSGGSGGTMRYNVEGLEGSVAVSRQPFGNAAPVATSSFAKLHERILAPACVSCHTAGHAYAVQSGLVLDAPVAYRNLVDGVARWSAAAAQGFSRLVSPGDAGRSFLHRKLLLWDPAQPATLGSPMPLGTTSLSLGQLEFVSRWIDAGAPEHGDVVDASLLDDTTLPAFAPFAPLAPPPAGKGLQLKVEPFSVQPNFERELFVYRRLDNAQPLYVTRFETRMRPNSHHLLLYGFDDSVPVGVIPAPDLVRDIRNPDGSLNILDMLPMAYHVFVAGSMTPNGGYAFPPGVALKLPANSGLDFNLHYVNRGSTPLSGEAYANLHTVDSSQVQHVASTLNLPNLDLSLPPRQRTTATRTFTFTQETRILTLTSHTHQLGERFVIRIAGGPRDGEVVYDNTEWEHPRIVTFAPPLVLQAGQGLTSIITYNNTTDRTIRFGLTSQDEMGIIFGYAY